MKKIKIAQIGTGHDHASASIATLKQKSDLFDLVGFATVPEDSLNLPRFTYEGCKSMYENIPQMTVEQIFEIPDLDAVCIETEDRALTKYAIMAAKRGLHIQMDKPGGIKDAEFDELIEIAKQKNIVLHLGYMYRYNPEILKLKQDIKDGKYGEIYAIEAQMNCLHEPDKRQWLGNYPGGMLYYLGCHLIDLVYSIQGEPIDVIPLSTPIHTDNVDACDFGMAVLKYKNGVSFVKSTAVEYGGFERRQLVVCGTKGTVEIKPIEWICKDVTDTIQLQTTTVRNAFEKDWCTKGAYYTSDAYGRYEGMFLSFADYVNGVKQNPFSYEYEKNLHKLILKCCQM